MNGAAARRLPVLPLAGLAALSLVWGLSVPLTKLGLQYFPPLPLAALRYLTAAPCFAVLLIGHKLPPPRALLAMAALGLLGILVGQASQILGIQLTSAAVATVITAMIPIFVVVLAGWRLRQKLRLTHGLGLGVALAGIVVIATWGQSLAVGALSATALAGDGLMLLSAVSTALYYVLSAELTRHYPVTIVAAWCSLFGAAALAAMAPVELAHAVARASAPGICIVLYLGLLVTVAGMWIWLHTLRLLPARIAAGSQYLQPLIGVAASAALLGDPIGSSFGIGTALVFVGIALTTLRRPLAP